MNAAEAALSGALASPGVVGVRLVDAVTGLHYATVGDADAVGRSDELAETVNLISDRLNQAGAAGELESVVVTSSRFHHITQVVPRGQDPLLLCASADRDRTNLALAMRHMADQAKAVLT
ncbi:hypothetical protein ACFZCY_29720 [Streptomyces sp. NPDC007983]|uniref:hypothetical protein n=1 Tax=Streptomyces sp. NPDC007983 TaxID=3364800 RepID=UPI0036E5DD10